MEKAPRILPHNLEVEQSLLGCLFLNQNAQSECFAKMQATDFYSTGHQKIFKAMYENYVGNKGVDYVTVCTRCERVDYRHEYYSYEHIHCFEY